MRMLLGFAGSSLLNLWGILLLLVKCIYFLFFWVFYLGVGGWGLGVGGWGFFCWPSI